MGSWPGVDLPAVLRLTMGELPELPYLPELPARGAAAGLVGRGIGLIIGLAADLQPAGWRLTGADAGSGRDQRRAKAQIRDDLDQLEEQAHDWEGVFKLSFPGPWTMAGTVELPRGELVLADTGARRELTQALALGIADFVAEVERRLPLATSRTQVDEPLLAAVLAGTLPTASGYRRHRAVDHPELSEGLEVVRAGRADVLHCCAVGTPWRTVIDAGFTPAADLDLLTAGDWDIFGPELERGTELWLGIAPTHVPDEVPGPDQLAERALKVLRPLELGPGLADRVVLTPACGLAGWTQRPAVQLLRNLTSAAGIVTEELTR